MQSKPTITNIFSGWIIRFHNQEGQVHRVNSPAQISLGNWQKWFQYGKYFRENDLPTIEWIYGKKSWRNKDSQLHRETGPAIIYPGHESYWINDRLFDSKEEFELAIFSRKST